MVHPVKQKDGLELAKYQKGLWKKPCLRYLFFELTDCCNLNCQHCGSKCEIGSNTFLPLAQIEKVLHSVADAYHPQQIMVCITGGEPLLHPELTEVIRLSKSLGFPVGMTTNGTLIDIPVARRLARAGLDTVAVSLDGIGAVHDAFRRSKGSFLRAMDGIVALKLAGIDPQVLTVVHKGNLSSLESMYQVLKTENIDSWRLVNVDPIGRAAEHANLLLNGAELRAVLNFIRAKRYDAGNSMEVTYGCSHFVTYEYEREVRDYYFQCGAGTMVASIMANGNIGACLDIERRDDLVQGSIFTDDFVDVWENRFQQFRTDRTAKSKSCSACIYQAVCMGDSAHTWDYDRNEPAYCAAHMLLEG